MDWASKNTGSQSKFYLKAAPTHAGQNAGYPSTTPCLIIAISQAVKADQYAF